MFEKHRDCTNEWDKEKRALKSMITSKPSKEAKNKPTVRDRRPAP